MFICLTAPIGNAHAQTDQQRVVIQGKKIL